MASSDEIVITKRIDTLQAIVSLRNDNIVHVHFKKHTIFDLHLQAELRAVYAEITGGKKSKFLFTSEEGFTLTKDAREHARKYPEPHIHAYALIADNIAYRIIANFVLKVNKPNVPYRLFAHADDAIRWLQKLG